MYDEIDVTKYCADGENELCVQVWHLGEDTQTYIDDTAGVWFEAESCGKVLAYSGENTQSRVMNEYRNGYCKVVTSQLEYSFLYDNTVVKVEYNKSKIIEKKCRKAHRKTAVFGRASARFLFYAERRFTRGYGKRGRGVCGLAFFLARAAKDDIHLRRAYTRRLRSCQIVNRDFSFEFIAEKGENLYESVSPHCRKIHGSTL